MIDQQTYERNERALLARDLARIDSAPLADRQAAREDWRKAMAETPELVAERVSWLLDGCYGKGSYDVAREIAGARSGNKVAQLSQLIAALEWQCSADFARKAWHLLNPVEQTAINAAISTIISAWRAEQDEEQANG